jgi:hypothetical protein
MYPAPPVTKMDTNESPKFARPSNPKQLLAEASEIKYS